MPPQERAPACPVTGRPAVRHIQWVAARLLTDLWRIEFKTDVRPSFRGIDRFGLWESPAGLYFFDPPLEGDRAFYVRFYSRMSAVKLFSLQDIRHEFLIAARRIEAGARVLDVGCGFASFRLCVPQATYTGLDPHFAEGGAIDEVRNENCKHCWHCGLRFKSAGLLETGAATRATAAIRAAGSNGRSTGCDAKHCANHRCASRPPPGQNRNAQRAVPPHR